MPTKNNGSKKELLEKYWKDFGHWHIKMNFLLKEIEKLKKQETIVSQISAFLLETQYIEFHIQGLITELELVKSVEPDMTEFSGEENPKEVYEMSLGEMKDEINKYNAGFLSKLKTNLYKLNKIRIRFAHHIFSYSTSKNDLFENAKEGLKENNKTLKSLNEVFKYIEKKSWVGKMMQKKKVNATEK